jgi:hypothetical protein
VLFELAEKAALLELQIEPLESGIDRLVGMDVHVDQAWFLWEGL